MSFFLRNGLTSSAIINMLMLLTLILPVGNLLPSTKYLFDKYFNEFRQGTQLNLYKWLGTGADPSCDVCESSYSKKDLIKKGSFFIHIPLEGNWLNFRKDLASRRPLITSLPEYRKSIGILRIFTMLKCINRLLVENSAMI
jgi:hypothetical protein